MQALIASIWNCMQALGKYMELDFIFDNLDKKIFRLVHLILLFLCFITVKCSVP